MQNIFLIYLAFIDKLFDREFTNNKTTTKTYRRTIQRIEKYNIKTTSDCGKYRFYKESVTS